MSGSRRPHIPTLAIGMSIFMSIGMTFQPSHTVLYLMAFVLLAATAKMTYRRLERQEQAGSRG
ncbi:MAG TPA: hypothetical protein VEW67_10235 [Thermoleophilaceae bacterium]|nr:hypothetical protein [Thermoleophilaceae bacterium]